MLRPPRSCQSARMRPCVLWCLPIGRRSLAAPRARRQFECDGNGRRIFAAHCARVNIDTCGARPLIRGKQRDGFRQNRPPSESRFFLISGAVLQVRSGVRIRARWPTERVLRTDGISPKPRVASAFFIPAAESFSDLRAGLRHGAGSQRSSVLRESQIGPCCASPALGVDPTGPQGETAEGRALPRSGMTLRVASERRCR